MSKYVTLIIGVGLIIAGILLAPFTGGLSLFLVKIGIGMVITGIGTLLSKGPVTGIGTAARNPIAPWNVIYGRARVGGTIVHISQFDDQNKYLDMVLVLACHPCKSVDSLLLDGHRITIDPASGSSYTPLQQHIDIVHIERLNDQVTVVLNDNIPSLEDGDALTVEDVETDASLNGRFPVRIISRIEPGSLIFSYTCGGDAVAIDGEGSVRTTWANYRSKVHMEVLLGDHTETFPGMILGTPDDGDIDSLTHNNHNQWGEDHRLLGKCAVFLRLHYNDEVFVGGVPAVSFHVSGKKDIYDPRVGPYPIVVSRATTLLNGWGNNEHVGPYELGEDQATNWGLNDDITYSYLDPDAAVSGEPGRGATVAFQHTHKYAGCIWSFASIPPQTLWLNVNSSVPASSGAARVLLRSAGIWYTLDGGTTWLLLYNSASHPGGWDSVALEPDQDYSLIQVMAFLDAHDNMVQFVMDINLATGPFSSIGYTTNAALCVADYLSNPTWGFRAIYGTEIPDDRLIAAANLCDETVPLAAGGTENRYTCNGTFPLSMKRGEVLQNLLTSCAGRLTYSGGQFVIHPAGWPGVSIFLGYPPIASATLSVLSSFTNGPTHVAAAAFYVGPIGLFEGVSAWLFDDSDWTTRVDSTPLDEDSLAGLVAGTVHAQFDIEDSIFGDNDPPSRLLIYDTWIDVTFEDGSTGRLIPTTVRAIPNISTGDIIDPENASDRNPLTYATIERHHFSALGFSPILQLGGYALEWFEGPPDTSPIAMAESSRVLAQAAGPFRWRSKLSIRELFNGVKGTYISPVNSWQSSDIPPYAQDTKHGYASGSPLYPEGDANMAADGGDRRWLDIQLPFTISTAASQRIAKIELMRRRQQGVGTFAFNMALYQATALDVIQMSLPLLGWTNKLLEVSAHRFNLDKTEGEGGATLLGTEIDVQETDPSIYDWDISEELSAKGYQQSDLHPTGEGTLDDMWTVNGT